MSDAARIGDRFAELLRESLQPWQFTEMKRRNEQDANYASGACASHDFCDANMPMAEAFEEVTGHEIDADSAEDAALWGAAWEHARQHHLGRPVHLD